MRKRDVVKSAIEGLNIRYVPWHCGFTVEATKKLQEHFGQDDLN